MIRTCTVDKHWLNSVRNFPTWSTWSSLFKHQQIVVVFATCAQCNGHALARCEAGGGLRSTNTVSKEQTSPQQPQQQSLSHAAHAELTTKCDPARFMDAQWASQFFHVFSQEMCVSKISRPSVVTSKVFLFLCIREDCRLPEDVSALSCYGRRFLG